MSLTVTCNAWTGNGKTDGEIADPAEWSLRRNIEAAPRLLAPRTVDLRNWQDPSVGWGVVIAEGTKIPAPLQELITTRKAPVFRYKSDWAFQYVLLRNADAGKDIDINAAPRGTAPDALPYYLLIYGSPKEVPWRLQYVLNANRCVGRLHLTGEKLTNYLSALASGDWGRSASPVNSNHALVWAVNHGSGDITELMRDGIAAPLAKELSEDNQIGAGMRFIDGSNDTADQASLIAALGTDRPGLIVTTSHGMTGPLGQDDAMRTNLGLPVDSAGQMVKPRELLDGWKPCGAIWYSHACCSAGSDDSSSFTELLTPASKAGQVIAAVAGLGAQVAPLPTELLGAKQPLRAFIGHVEPTFDWTLQQPATGQLLTSSIIDALYGRMYVAKGDIERPIGEAFRDWYGRTNGLRSMYEKALRGFNHGEATDDLLLALQLAARDVESTVILGDPTVAMPALE